MSQPAIFLDANQLLLGVFCLAIHQANVPLNQQLMSQTHTVCSFYNGPFHCSDRVEEMRGDDEKKNTKRDRLKRGKKIEERVDDI